jgi:putative inorganic carbon (hco3(-)) transporter
LGRGATNPLSGARRRWVRCGGLAGVSAGCLLLAFWPPLAQPFSLPKTALLLFFGVAALVWTLVLPGSPAPLLPAPPLRSGWRRALPALAGFLPLAWLASLLFSSAFAVAPSPLAIAREAGAALLLLGLSGGRGGVRGPLRAIALLGAGESLLVLLQQAGLDPLFALAPAAGGRLRAFGTLGNPDFAAGWLGASLWAALAEAWSAWDRGAPSRQRWLAAAVLHALALASLRSFATLLGLAAGGGFVLLALRGKGGALPDTASDTSRDTASDTSRDTAGHTSRDTAGHTSRDTASHTSRDTASHTSRDASRGPALPRLPRARAVATACAAVALLCAAGLASRSGGQALRGRLHLWATGASGLTRLPLFGHGPGSVALLHPAWEAARFERGEAGERERRFAGPQDHLHQDLLERLLEQGAPGALVFALLAAAALAAAAAAVASIAARGLADFPAARPAELGLFALCAALALRPAPAQTPRPKPTARLDRSLYGQHRFAFRRLRRLEQGGARSPLGPPTARSHSERRNRSHG